MATFNRVTIKFTGTQANSPFYGSACAVGADLKADLKDPVTINPGQRTLIPTGVFLAIPDGYEGQVRPRSGLAVKNGITVLNAPGTIDSDYRGEVKVPLINLGQQAFTVQPEDRIAQLVIAPVCRAEFVFCENIDQTGRGAGGFGSTGI